MTANLLITIKEYLRVTWSDDDLNIANIAMRGIAIIDKLAGKPQDYETPGEAQSILLDYVRYSYNHASGQFLEDFAPDILHLQLGVAIADMGAGADG